MAVRGAGSDSSFPYSTSKWNFGMDCHCFGSYSLSFGISPPIFEEVKYLERIALLLSGKCFFTATNAFLAAEDSYN